MSKTQTHTNKQKPIKNDGVKAVKEINDRDSLIIDEYFNNFFNKSQAVLSVMTDIKHQSQANHVFNSIVSKKEVKAYIEQKHAELRHETKITATQLLRERLNWASVKAADLVGLDEEGIKKLPNEIQRAIQSIKINERTENNRKGEEVTYKTFDLKLIDKNDNLKEISKLIGAYEIHNQQQSKAIDLSKATPDQLNTVLQLFKDQQNSNTNTIDV
jgi:hypothetical protein